MADQPKSSGRFARLRDGARRTEGEGGFQTGAVIAVVILAGLLFTAALYAMVREREGRDFGDWTAPSSNGATAIGLGALAELLRGLDRQVEDKAGAAGRAAPGAVVLLSDLTDVARTETMRDRYADAGAILAVLPKWRIPFRSFGRRFADRVYPVAEAKTRQALSDLLRAVSPGGEGPPEIWRDRRAEAGFSENPLRATPRIFQLQAIAPDPRLIPVIAQPDGGLLLAQLRTGGFGPPVFVLADPDPLLNHGLDDGDNALFALEVLDWLGAGDASVAFDDGPGTPLNPSSLWVVLFQPPLLAVTLAIAAFSIVLGLIAMGRFGRRAADRPGQAAGKDALLDAAAALLRQGDGDRAVIRRFFDETLREVGTRLQAPKLGERRSLIKWFEPQEKVRRARFRAAALEAELESIAGGAPPRPEQLTALARDINAWREEMLRGHR